VSIELRDRVLAAADTLGYQINSIAQTLRRRSSRIIGFCTTHTSTAYLRELANSLDGIATQNGYELVQVLTHEEPDREMRCIKGLIGRQADGLILLPSLAPQAALNAIAKSRTPAVVVDRLCQDSRFNYVIIDNRGAMRTVVRSLVVAGYSRILFVSQNLAVITTRHRLEGLEEEAHLEGSTIRYEVIERGDDEPLYVERLRRILSGNDAPTAIVTGNSKVAVSTAKALQTLGLRWPKDVAFVTFEDPEWASIVSPPLSTVKTPNDAIASAVWNVLKSQMMGEPSSPQTICIAPELIVRESSSPIQAPESHL
jgi:LacI family transcriptional regulator